MHTGRPEKKPKNWSSVSTNKTPEKMGFFLRHRDFLVPCQNLGVEEKKNPFRCVFFPGCMSGRLGETSFLQIAKRSRKHFFVNPHEAHLPLSIVLQIHMGFSRRPFSLAVFFFRFQICGGADTRGTSTPSSHALLADTAL